MNKFTKALALPVAVGFGAAEIYVASIAVRDLRFCPDPDHQLCGVPDRGHPDLTAVALVSGTASITWVMISTSEGKVEAVPAPPPAPLSGLGVSLLVEKPAQPPDKPPGIGRRQVAPLWRSG